jgi:hypothetical protein
MSIPVVAIAQGFIGGRIREEGEKFAIESEDQLGSWMDRLDGGPNPCAAKRQSVLGHRQARIVSEKAAAAKAKAPAAKKPAAGKPARDEESAEGTGDKSVI